MNAGTGVRTYLRSPVALAWTLLGVIVVGSVVAAGSVVAVRVGAIAGRSGFIADPMAPADPGGFAFTLGFAAATVAVAALLWLPCSLAIAYAVGSRVRSAPVTFGDSIDLLRARPEPLYRWVKTRIAIEPIAGRLLTESDVSPAEVAVGCDAFVVPALALDAPTIRAAVGRANQAVPRSGRERIALAGIGSTGLFAVGAFALGAAGGAFLPPGTLALGAAVVGVVLTAALDTAWRAGAYAEQDLDAGFL